MSPSFLYFSGFIGLLIIVVFTAWYVNKKKKERKIRRVGTYKPALAKDNVGEGEYIDDDDE